MADLEDVMALDIAALQQAITQLNTGAADFEAVAKSVRQQDTSHWTGDSYDRFVLQRDSIVARVKLLAMFRRGVALELGRLGPAWETMCVAWATAARAYAAETVIGTLPTGVSVAVSTPSAPTPGCGSFFWAPFHRRSLNQINVDVWRTPKGIQLKARLQQQGLDPNYAAFAKLQIVSSYKSAVNATFVSQEKVAHDRFYLACNQAAYTYRALAAEVARNLDSMSSTVPNSKSMTDVNGYRGKAPKELAGDSKLRDRLKDREFLTAFIAMLGPQRAAEFFEAIARDPENPDSDESAERQALRDLMLSVMNETWPARQIDRFAEELPIASCFEVISSGALDSPAGMAIANRVLAESATAPVPDSMNMDDLSQTDRNQRLIFAIDQLRDRLKELGWTEDQIDTAMYNNPSAAIVAVINRGIGDSPALARYIMERNPNLSVPDEFRLGNVGGAFSDLPITWNTVAESLMQSGLDGTIEERQRVRELHLAEISKLMREDADFAKDIPDEWASSLARIYMALIETPTEYANRPELGLQPPSVLYMPDDYIAGLLTHDPAAVELFVKLPWLLGELAVEHLQRGGGPTDGYMSELDQLDDILERGAKDGRLKELKDEYDVDYTDFLLGVLSMVPGPIGTTVSWGQFIWTTADTIHQINEANPELDKLKKLPEFQRYVAELDNDELIVESIKNRIAIVNGITREQLEADTALLYLANTVATYILENKDIMDEIKEFHDGN